MSLQLQQQPETTRERPKVLTCRQREVLELIREHIGRHGYPPSVRELAADLRIGFNAVQGHLKALERKGWIQRRPGIARGLQLVECAS